MDYGIQAASNMLNAGLNDPISWVFKDVPGAYQDTADFHANTDRLLNQILVSPDAINAVIAVVSEAAVLTASQIMKKVAPNIKQPSYVIPTNKHLRIPKRIYGDKIYSPYLVLEACSEARTFGVEL